MNNLFDEAAEQLRSLRDLLRFGASRFEQAELFYGHGTDNALDEAFALALHVLALPYDLPEAYLDSRLTTSERQQVLAIFVERIERRVPAAYLTGQAFFAGLPFQVDERVLVPRSPIAELIEAGFEPWLAGSDVALIADIGTGSGCIAIACAYAFPDAQVDGLDIDVDALAVAQENVEAHDLVSRVALMESDLFSAVEGQVYDLVVANPPYVDAQEMARRAPEFVAEPDHALASGMDGLDHPLRILAAAAEHLSDGGLLVLEVGASEPALRRVLPELEGDWPRFERGGSGVLVTNKAALLAQAENIKAAVESRLESMR